MSRQVFANQTCQFKHRDLIFAKHGFEFAINVLEGFEGDKNDFHQRSSVNGWRFHGLPWEQH